MVLGSEMALFFLTSLAMVLPLFSTISPVETLVGTYSLLDCKVSTLMEDVPVVVGFLGYLNLYCHFLRVTSE